MSFNCQNYLKITSFIGKNYINAAKPTIIAVSKMKSAQTVEEAIYGGIKNFGENKVQEAYNKFFALKKNYKNITLHMLGSLQTNKVKKALSIFDYFHTLDRENLAKEFTKDSNYEITINKKFFIQINTGKEKQKSGISILEANDFISFCKHDLNINIIGLMCIPPIKDDPQPHFKILKKIAEKNKLNDLSMGMSNDFKIAIMEGATFIRIGTILFGSR